jgi:hypothetical protein
VGGTVNLKSSESVRGRRLSSLVFFTLTSVLFVVSVRFSHYAQRLDMRQPEAISEGWRIYHVVRSRGASQRIAATRAISP